MPNAHGQRMRLRLFIEGIEIPVISASVQAAPNSPSVCSIQIPPLAEATRFLPRSIVHLFFLDMYAVQSPHLVETGSNAEKPHQQDPSQLERSQNRAYDQMGEGTKEQGNDAFGTYVDDAFNDKYKMLFGGEMVGWTWTKTVDQRSIVLQCEDFSNYWDYAYQWNNTGLFGPGAKAVFSGGATNLHTDFLSSKGEDLARILLHGKSATFPNLTGLAAGIIKLIEGIGGTYFPPPGSGAKRIAGQNIFFSLAELRLKITHMVAAVQDDQTSQALLARAGYGGMFTRALGGLGSQTSIRQAINALTKIIFHEMYPQPCPLFIPGSDGDVQGLKTTKLTDNPKWAGAADAAQKTIIGLDDIRKSLKKLSDLPEFSRPPTSSVTAEAALKMASMEKQLKSQLVTLRKAPKPAEKIITTSAMLVAKARIHVTRFRPDAPPSILDIAFRSIDSAVVELTELFDLTVREKASKDSYSARLVQQVFRPDIWFSSPPRCNVIFPEGYNQMTYRRSFLQEPTRFLLKTNDEFFGEDFLFDRLYFAPQAGGTAKSDHARLKDVLRNNLLDHELFTGILPIFEKMGEFNIFAGQTRSKIKKGANRGQYSGTKKDAIAGAVSKVGPAQRSANFMYFKHRFNARRMQIRGKFNPYIAMGCPGLIIDKHVDGETIARYNELKGKLNKSDAVFTGNMSGKKVDIGEGGLAPQELSEVLGTNFLGNFTSVSHVVSQNEPQGITEIMCSYPRQSEESVEFLGSIPEEQLIKKKAEEVAVRGCNVAALNPPKLLSLGPQLGRITNVQDITKETLEAAQELPLFDSASPQSSRTSPLTVPVGFPITAAVEGGASGKKIEEITGGPDVAVTFHGYHVTEEISRYRKQKTLIPAEEFIRPGWYGDLWGSAKIGKVYEELFGIGSITDEQTITGPGGSSGSSVQEDSLNASEEASKAEDADDPRQHAPALLALENGATIQDAVEFLHLTYSYIRQSEMDTEEFIRSYTWRPIATLLDIFGTTDLEFTQDGSRVIKGTEGFHSRAFGPYENLHGLADPSIESIIGIGAHDINNRKVDTRLRKYKAVQRYASAIRFSRAILG